MGDAISIWLMLRERNDYVYIEGPSFLHYVIANTANSTRRLHLIMKVLRAAPFRVDAIAIEKFRTWWHLITSLGAKLESHFDLVRIVTHFIHQYRL